MPARLDKEKIKKDIAGILERIRSEEDPHLLNEYRALLRGEVSLFRRSWVAAYLLKLWDQGALGRADMSRRGKPGAGRQGNAEGKSSRGGSGENPRAHPDTSAQPSLAEEESKRLFISIGRNRRVFPREILGLINAKTAIQREDIGSIRILDNYSFVQVRDSAAEPIIAALNGCSFRGRTLTVNYAKFRKDGGLESPENSEMDAPEAEMSGMEHSEQVQDHLHEEDIDSDARQ
jgi:hypothetical protein